MDINSIYINSNEETHLEKKLLEKLNSYGIVILTNFYTYDQITEFKKDFDKIFKKNEIEIEVLDKEDSSKDERIFNCEKYSSFIKNNFSDNPLFERIVFNYNKFNKKNKKTLINKVKYKKGETRNSGAGWHRDNHDMQFKTIMYLSDVTEKNGNFQFLTNSSKKQIGFPTPRTKFYNTRFSDEIVKSLISEKNKVINIVGKEGTIILVDTTYIHRGNIILEGERKAITQYYF